MSGRLKLNSITGLAWSTVQQHGRLVVGMAAALFVLGAAQASVILLVKGFLAIFFESDAANLPAGSDFIVLADLLPHWVVREFSGMADLKVSSRIIAIALPAGVLGAGLIKSLGSYVYTRLQQEFSFHAGTQLRDILFSRVAGQPYEILSSVSPGSWMSLLINDVAFVQMRLSEIMTSFLRGGIAIIASLGVMFLIHWPSALVMLGVVPILAWSTGLVGRRIALVARAVQKAMQQIASLTLEIRSRFEFMRAQKGESRDLGRFDCVNDSYFAMILRSVLIRSAFAPTLEFLGFAIFAGFLFAVHSGFVSFGASNGGVGGEVLVQFMVAVAFMVKPLRDVGEQLSRFHETKGALGRCFSILGEAEDPERDSANSHKTSGDNVKKVVDALQIAKVKYTWRSSGRGFSARDLKLPVGQAVAVVGPSGSGKSTLLKVLSGLVHPDEWEASHPLDSVVGDSALVPQAPFLFSASILENVSYGSPNASVDHIWRSLETIQVLDFVRSLPEGLDSQFSSLAANFSGGQVQRLVIARALLRDRRFLLLDEATSALDAATEGDILRELVALTRKKSGSLVAVTHRLQWLQFFDEIWFVEDGTVLMKDSLSNLMQVERFARFCASQEGVSS